MDNLTIIWKLYYKKFMFRVSVKYRLINKIKKPFKQFKTNSYPDQTQSINVNTNLS
jgi:hypothetical protein